MGRPFLVRGNPPPKPHQGFALQQFLVFMAIKIPHVEIWNNLIDSEIVGGEQSIESSSLFAPPPEPLPQDPGKQESTTGDSPLFQSKA